MSHLPKAKKAEILWVKDLIFEEFAVAIAGRRADDVRDGKILMLILHGPYASGAWVDDPAGIYFADYEMLAVVSSDRLADVGEFWLECERKLLFATANREHLRTPVRLTIQSLAEINREVEQGDRYFQRILDEGVILHDTPGLLPHHHVPVPHSVEAAEATVHLEEGLALVDEFLGSAKLSFTKGWRRKAAFDLHQATERLYNIVLLVLAGRTPHTHNIVQLRRLAEAATDRLSDVWPAETKEDRRCFELLRSAYNKARYNRHYRVSEDELRRMLDQVEYLYDLTEEVCDGWIAEAESAPSAQAATSVSANLRFLGRRASAATEDRTARKRIVADYQEALTAHPEPIADAKRLPHPKNAIKAALLAELDEADTLEAVRALTESFLSLAKWLLLNEHELSALEATRSDSNAGDILDDREAKRNRDYARLANRVWANTIVLGAEMEHGALRFP
ncbi:MAG: HEPN domain-containing protein [Brevundimonas sp.]|uniref:HEPN domain-containing protein n=1 Tax=Brevundimonas sp. TaxID=1871086 RepID=UPI002487F9D6|nr:HEPN domain-containing protein [Brevundimonas sp.]MDI1328339.1 HEPN domain-containing protein [Brevundimonas sp.]